MHPVLAEILGPDMLVIIAIIALLFGGSQVPQFARSLGQAKREFEQGIADGHKPAEPAEPAEPSEPANDKVTMRKEDLDALLAEKEAAARQAATPEPPAES